MNKLKIICAFSDHELCHSTSKPIGDEEDTLKFFMTFDFTPCEPIFKVVVGSQIVVPSTIPPSQWYSLDSNPWPWLWYNLSNRKLCHSISKPIGNEEDTVKSFMAFDIMPHKLIFRVVVGSQIVVPLHASCNHRVHFLFIINQWLQINCFSFPIL